MDTLSNIIVLSFLLFYRNFHEIISHNNIMQTEQNSKEYQEIGVLEAFEATRSDFVVITKKNEKQCFRLQLSIPGTLLEFPPYW